MLAQHSDNFRSCLIGMLATWEMREGGRKKKIRLDKKIGSGLEKLICLCSDWLEIGEIGEVGHNTLSVQDEINFFWIYNTVNISETHMQEKNWEIR